MPVLKNKFGIKDEKTLDLVEAEQSRASMMLLYEHGFHDFSNRGVKKIHRTLFEDVYEWAGNYRVINIIKREPVLAGQSVWYSNAEDIPHDLKCAWDENPPSRMDLFVETKISQKKLRINFRKFGVCILFERETLEPL